MASVTGRTAESIDELLDTMVTSIRVSDTGRLIYKTKAGIETDGGPIVAPDIAVDTTWPVGSIYISVYQTDPHESLGVGTWQRFGMGRTLVSQNSFDTAFDVAEEIGGEKAHLLSSLEMPNHFHTINHTHTVQMTYNRAGVSNDEAFERVTTINFGSASTYDISGSTSDSSTAYSGLAGGNIAHNNMPPYIVVYMWKRVS